MIGLLIGGSFSFSVGCVFAGLPLRPFGGGVDSGFSFLALVHLLSYYYATMFCVVWVASGSGVGSF